MDQPFFMHGINVENIEYFRFIIPSCYAGGHEDVEISVDYGMSIDNSKRVTYNAWARKGNSSVKFFVYTNRIPATGGIVDSIMADMNINPEFGEKMNQFVEFIEKNNI